MATLLKILVSGNVPPNSSDGEFTPVDIHDPLLSLLYSQSYVIETDPFVDEAVKVDDIVDGLIKCGIDLITDDNSKANGETLGSIGYEKTTPELFFKKLTAFEN